MPNKNRIPNFVQQGSEGHLSTTLPDDDPRSKSAWQAAVESGETVLNYEEWFQVKNAQIAAANYEQEPRPRRISGSFGDLVHRSSADNPEDPLGLQRWQQDVRGDLTDLSYEDWLTFRSEHLAEQPAPKTAPVVTFLCEIDKDKLLAAGKDYQREIVLVDRETASSWYGPKRIGLLFEPPSLEWPKSQWMIDTHIPAGEVVFPADEKMPASPEMPEAISKNAWATEVANGLTTLGYVEWYGQYLNEV